MREPDHCYLLLQHESLTMHSTSRCNFAMRLTQTRKEENHDFKKLASSGTLVLSRLTSESCFAAGH